MLIAQLQERYGITKKPLYSRAKALGLEFSKNSDNKSFANQKQVELLDQLHLHLKEGGILKNFVPFAEVEIDNGHDTPGNTATRPTTQHATQHKEDYAITVVEPTTQPSQPTTQPSQPTTQPTTQELLTQAAILIAEAKDPLWNLAALEQAKEHNWLLSTAQIISLIGIRPRCKKGEKSYKRGGFTFIKSGKIGRQIAWRVLSSAE